MFIYLDKEEIKRSRINRMTRKKTKGLDELAFLKELGFRPFKENIQVEELEHEENNFLKRWNEKRFTYYDPSTGKYAIFRFPLASKMMAKDGSNRVYLSRKRKKKGTYCALTGARLQGR